MTEPIVVTTSISQDALEAGIPCCTVLRSVIAEELTTLVYEPRYRWVRMLDTPPGTGAMMLSFCPFCGSELLPELQWERNEVALERGFEPAPFDDVPFDDPGRFDEAFSTDRWWRDALMRDPRAFFIALPNVGDVLNAGGTELVVVAVHRKRRSELFLVIDSASVQASEPWAAISSPRAYSQGRWQTVAHDLELAAALGARIKWTGSAMSQHSDHWQLGSSSSLANSGLPAIEVDESDERYSYEIEREIERSLRRGEAAVPDPGAAS